MGYTLLSALDNTCYKMDAFFGIKYVLKDSENFDEFLKFSGFGYVARKAASTLKQSVCLTRTDDGKYKFEFTSTLASSKVIFTPGEEFIEDKPLGEKVKSMITIDGNVMTHEQTDEKGVKTKHVREFYLDKIVALTTVENFDKTLKRIYVKV